MSTSNPAVEVGVVPREIATGVAGLAFLEGLRDGTQPAPPFAVETDVWIVEVESGRVVFEATPSSRFYNPLGTVHGGWISTLLDSAMGCAVHSVLKAGQAYTTIDMTINFVRPGVREDRQAQLRGQDHPRRRTHRHCRGTRVGRGRHAHRPWLGDVHGDGRARHGILSRLPR